MLHAFQMMFRPKLVTGERMMNFINYKKQNNSKRPISKSLLEFSPGRSSIMAKRDVFIFGGE
jgi:hypothetical protein